MSKYNEGDLIRAELDETTLVGRLVERGNVGLAVQNCAAIDFYERNGFTITVIEKAKPKVELPSEPGYYSDRHDDIWEAHENGRWLCVSDNDYSGRVTEYAPFTRLESRAVTAKAVLDRVAAKVWPFGPTTFEGHEDLVVVAREFGATS